MSTPKAGAYTTEPTKEQRVAQVAVATRTDWTGAAKIEERIAVIQDESASSGKPVSFNTLIRLIASAVSISRVPH